MLEYMRTEKYPSDLTDLQWNRIKKMLPKAKSFGRPRELDLRDVLDAIFYVVRGGIAWRMLPKDFPHWKSVYHYFRLWKQSGLFKRLNDKLRSLLRKKAGRQRQPSAAILDTQSVKTTEVGGSERGYDANKKINGRKRHVLVDAMGLLLVVGVHSAGIQDRDGARRILECLSKGFSRLRLIWADSIYNGGLAEWIWSLRTRRKVRLEIVKRSDNQKGFAVQPRRWVVERTFGWLGRHRRLSKDYETLPESSEAMIYLAMIRLMLRRLDAA
jgi:putative transposase